MRVLTTDEMVLANGKGGIGCAVAIIGFGIGVAGLATTGVGAPLAATLIASQGYVAATVGLATCFSKKF